MPFPKIIPALADLTQDIAGPVPMSLLHDWARGEQNLESAATILTAFEIKGTVVSTDTSGLSKMTEERDLLDVIALISTPKEIVHAIGVEIGGTPIGTWVADNSEMHYPDSVPIERIVDGMAEAQKRIAGEVPIKIGMCVHDGVFYHIGGGLYGRDADTVEALAEQYAAPGEVLLTRTVADRVAPAGMTFTPRSELSQVHPPGVFSLGECPHRSELKGSDRRYPHPFPREFFRRLDQLKAAEQPQLLRETIYAKYLRERVIVFAAREREAVGTENLATLLDDLVTNGLMDAIITRVSTSAHHIAGLGGGLAIVTFATPRRALEYAREIRAKFIENGLAVRIGVDQGPVLFFKNPKGPSGIAGDPVNIASKISEDVGVAGKIHVTTRVADQIPGLPKDEPFQIKISLLQLTGVTL